MAVKDVEIDISTGLRSLWNRRIRKYMRSRSDRRTTTTRPSTSTRPNNNSSSSTPPPSTQPNQRPPKSGRKNRNLPHKLYLAAIQNDVNHFIQVQTEIASENIVDLLTPLKNTVLHVAAGHINSIGNRRGGQEKIVTLLVNHFPQLITKQNKVGDTALHVAVKAGRYDAVQILLNESTTTSLVLVKMRNKKGNTALHECLINQHRTTGIYNSLIRQDPSMCFVLNKERESPLYLAVKAGDNNHVLDILSNMKMLENQQNMYKGKILTGKSPLIPAILQRNKGKIIKQISFFFFFGCYTYFDKFCPSFFRFANALVKTLRLIDGLVNTWVMG